MEMRRRKFCSPVRKWPSYGGCRLKINIPAGKPEVAIYSQIEEYTNGRQPTWDSPDIDTYHGSADKVPKLLDPLIARIKNLSEVGPATNALIHCEIGEFGIGTISSRIGTQMVSIKELEQVELSFPLPPGTVNGEQRITSHINIDLPGDLNPINNYGSQITYGGYSSVIGRDTVFDFPLLNNSGTARDFSLAVLQNDLAARVEPQDLTLAPFEQRQIRLFCTVPASVHPDIPSGVVRMEATVMCLTTDGRLYGGVTFFVLVDN